MLLEQIIVRICNDLASISANDCLGNVIDLVGILEIIPISYERLTNIALDRIMKIKNLSILISGFSHSLAFRSPYLALNIGNVL